MADDIIDIEEHDILDNPVIRRIFPDISIIKKEVLQFNDEVHRKQNPVMIVSHDDDDIINHNVEQETEKTPVIVIEETNGTLRCHSNEPADQYFCARFPDDNFSKTGEGLLNDDNTFRTTRTINYTSKAKSDKDPDIINLEKVEDKSVSGLSLVRSKNIASNISGKKANKSKVKSDPMKSPKALKKTVILQKSIHSLNQAKQSTQNSVQSENSSRISTLNSHCADSLPWKGNKLILGTKLSAINIHSVTLKKTNKLSNAKVLVENLETFLSKSSRYCKICFILFPSNKTLADHSSLIHSQLNDELSESTISNIHLKHKSKFVKVNNKYKCNFCERLCSSSSNLLRHERRFHSLNIKKRTRKNNSTQSQSLSKFNEKTNNLKCSHCNNTFPTQQILINHMYNVLQSKNSTDIKSIEIVKGKRMKKYMNSRVFYRCPLCSYYFKQKIMYIKHVKNKHRETGKIKLEKEAFDPVCKYCSNTYCNVQSFNVHVWKHHQKQLPRQIMKVVNESKYTIGSNSRPKRPSFKSNKKKKTKGKIHHRASIEICNKYLLKSVFFKCLICDVCFLSGRKAANHIAHADTGTRWKCLKCLEVFTKEEQNNHTQQHLFGDNFEVIRICEKTYLYLLYKCSNCAGYFREKDFFEHYSLCELQPPDAAYCKTCHILLDNKIKESHNIHHKRMRGKELNNILVESDVITHIEGPNNKVKVSYVRNKHPKDDGAINEGTDNKMKETSYINHPIGQNELIKPFVESDVEICDKETDDPIRHKELINPFVESDVEICDRETDDPFTHNELMNPFVESDVEICDKETDSKKDKVEKGYDKSRNENVDSVANGPHVGSMKRNTRTMLRKSLRFIYCNTCKCFIFVTRVRKLYKHIKARCSNVTNYVCKYCGLVLSNKAINSHRKLHQNESNLTLSNFKFYDLKSCKEILPPVPKYPNCHLCKKHFITKTAILSHLCNEDYLTCPLCHIKLSDTAFPLHMSFHNYNQTEILNECTSVELALDSKESLPTSLTKLRKLNNNLDQDCQNSYFLVYICKICKVTVDNYDSVIEHCHYHIGGEEDKEIVTKPCDLCNLIFDVRYFENHKMLHLYNQNKTFSILSYDAFYCTAKDTIWLSHLFGSLSKKEINNILKNSIYNFERKIKMRIVQDGLSHLTVYKCAKCNGFIDPPALYEHCRIDLLCYKSELVACSICGILLISKEFLIKHEKIHETSDVTLKSYRIVLFNSNVDKNINHALSMPSRYVLYECRNCSGIVDNKQFQYHKCDFDDLAKCSHCGLLLYSNNYMLHVVKHKEFCSFQEINMNVILLGAVKNRDIIKDRLKPSFRGKKFDYIVYKCNKCQVCLEDKQTGLTHDCVKDSAVSKCVSCDLYFEDSVFKNHRKLHECDLYFSKENLTVIELDLVYSRSPDVDIIVIEDDEELPKIDANVFRDNSANNNTNASDNVCSAERVVEKYEEIFRCLCGLHFLTEASALSHYKLTKCNNPRSLKQTCPKCGLSFKPNILYSHLLKHHANKNVSYKFKINQILN